MNDIAPWPKVHLSDLLTDIQPGFASGVHNVTGSGIPHFRPMNVSSDGRIDRSVVKYVDPGAGRTTQRLTRGDVLFNNTNSPELVGKTALFDDDDAPAFSNHMTRLRTDPSRLDPAYLALRLHQAWREGWFQEHCNNHVSQASIGRDVLRTFEIELPPLEVQHSISAASAGLELRRVSAASHVASSRQTMDRFRQSVLAAACSGRLTADWREVNSPEPTANLVLAAKARRREGAGRSYREPDLNSNSPTGESPPTWSLAPLGLLVEDIKYGTSQRSEYDTKGVPVLRIPNVSTGKLTLSDLKYASLSDRELEALALRASDLLMIRSNGSPQLVGRAALVPTSAVGMAYAGYLMRLRVDEAVLDSRYLAIVLGSPATRHQIEMPLRSTSGVNNINTGEVRSIAVPLPSLLEQAEIVRRVDALTAGADRLGQRLDEAASRVERTSQAFLSKACRGDVVVAADQR
jgi:type I restriction enzyme, S subunit